MNTPRVYDFPLPKEISGFQDMLAVNQLQADGMWDKIPADLQRKLVAGEGWFGPGVEATKADLDELPDDVWLYIANKLGLAWHKAAPSKPPTKGT